MPVHDWPLVPAGIFQAFHVDWIPEIQKVLNGGLLPPGYYALPEQPTGHSITDVLTLHASEPPQEILVRRRSLAIRHISGHRLVALLEIISPANKDRSQSVEEFAAKTASALRVGIHVMVVDLFPPGQHDLHGMHGAIQGHLNQFEQAYDLPGDEPLTLSSYVAGPRVDAYLEHLAVGHVLPDMPLFLRPDRYVNLPLEAPYQEAYRGMPAFWRDVLEGRTGNSTT